MPNRVVNPNPRLFFVDELCKTCPMFLFDPKSKTWNRFRALPEPGDHIVVNMMTEKVVMSVRTPTDFNCSSLNRKNDVRLWDGSYPDGMKVTDTRVSAANSFETIEDEPLTTAPDEPIRAFRI